MYSLLILKKLKQQLQQMRYTYIFQKDGNTTASSTFIVRSAVLILYICV